MKLSIVATLYKSEQYLEAFYQRASAVAFSYAGDAYELIFVNDGSPDNSLDMAVQLTVHDHHVIVIDLSRNFGHHNAIKAGLEYTRGEYIFLIDSDLEEEPEWLLDFSVLMNSERADVVYGVQKRRKGGIFERWSGAIYYCALNWLLAIDHPKNITTARLMTRRYVGAFLSHTEVEAPISCLWVITGFKQSASLVQKHMTSKTTYTFIKKLKYLTNAITSFSIAPLKMIFFCGLMVFCTAMLYVVILIVNRFFMSTPVDGWTSIMVSIWILGGMIISFIGIIGIYLAKIFSEVKKRPNALIRDVYQSVERL